MHICNEITLSQINWICILNSCNDMQILEKIDFALEIVIVK